MPPSVYALAILKIKSKKKFEKKISYLLFLTTTYRFFSLLADKLCLQINTIQNKYKGAITIFTSKGQELGKVIFVIIFGARLTRILLHICASKYGQAVKNNHNIFTIMFIISNQRIREDYQVLLGSYAVFMYKNVQYAIATTLEPN